VNEEIERKRTADDLQAALEAASRESALEEARVLGDFLVDVHPADLAEWLQELDPREMWRVFSTLDAEMRSEVLQHASEGIRQELTEVMRPAELIEVVEAMPADEVVDLLSLVDDSVSEQVLRSVDFERAEGLRELAEYPEDSAGGLMTTEYPRVEAGTRVGDAIKVFKQTDNQVVEDADGIFVVDVQGCPVGYLSGHDLLTHSIHDPVDEAMEPVAVTASPRDDQENLAREMLKYGLTAMPVVDSAGGLVGVVMADDLSEVIAEEAQEDILKIVGAGATAEEPTRLPVWRRVMQRIPMQVLTVIGGVITAWLLRLGLGEAAGETGPLRYLPIIIGVAGNVGVQASTILVRAFATGELAEGRELSVLGGEVLTGLTIGVLCGLLTAVIAAFVEYDDGAAWGFGIAIGLAICVAVTWAALLGCLVPIFCRRSGIDPAIVAGPFMITVSDVSGAVIYIGVVQLVLSELA
jgi:magnesium transporter